MKTVIRMLVTLTVIGIVSGGLLSKVGNWAAPQIERHMQEAIRQAIATVHPSGTRSEKVATDALQLYRVFDDDNRAVGYAMSVTGSGFSDKITLMVGVSEDLDHLRHRDPETDRHAGAGSQNRGTRVQKQVQ